MNQFPCPNPHHYCQHNSGTSTRPVIDAFGNVYLFHDKCLMDVHTGWSGGLCSNLSGETFDQMYRRVMKANFAAVGVTLPEGK